MPRRRPYTRPKNGKLQLFVRVHPGAGGLKTTTREKTVTDAEIAQWVKEQRAKFGMLPDVAGGLRATVAAYFAQRHDMPSRKPYIAIMDKWVGALGADRPPLSVETSEIDAILTRWLLTLSPETVHKRRGILFTFYGTMFPKAVNPVKDAVDPPRPEPEARELAYQDIDAAIASMADYSRAGARNLAKVKLRLMAETGFPLGVIGCIKPEHVDRRGERVYIDGREKGAGIPPRWIELERPALDALTAFDAANAYGPYTVGSISAVNNAFKRACVRTGLHMQGVTAYILRHSFLTQLYREHPDEATVQRLGLHAPGSRVTRRYTKAAHPGINRAALVKLRTARRKALSVPKRSQKLPTKVAHGRKSFKRAS